MSPTQSWIDYDPKTHFSIANIPFGIISTKSDPSRRAAVAIGDYALDLAAFASAGGFSGLSAVASHLDVFSKPFLNDFAALGRPVHAAVRAHIQSVFDADTKTPELLKDNQALRSKALLPRTDVENHLAFNIGDYTDFYASRNHAYNVGVLFRGPENALQPNYNYLPVAYHGRASSVVVSGTPVNRPWGQILTDPAVKVPSLEQCRKLDLELELAAFMCKSNKMGEPIPVNEADQYIFGYALMNDWSARDIQAWEYVPLGPFTSKNMGTSIGAWIVLADALEPFKAAGLQNDKELMPYLKEDKKLNVHDIHLEVDIIAPSGKVTNISKTSSSNLLWSWPQMIAHHTITGCNLRPGDLFGSGTISGTERGTEGSLLEMTGGGKTAITIGDGEERKFLQDGDTLVIRGVAGKEGAYVGFGECSGKVSPAVKLSL